MLCKATSKSTSRRCVRQVAAGSKVYCWQHKGLRTGRSAKSRKGKQNKSKRKKSLNLANSGDAKTAAERLREKISKQIASEEKAVARQTAKQQEAARKAAQSKLQNIVSYGDPRGPEAPPKFPTIYDQQLAKCLSAPSAIPRIPPTLSWFMHWNYLVKGAARKELSLESVKNYIFFAQDHQGMPFQSAIVKDINNPLSLWFFDDFTLSDVQTLYAYWSNKTAIVPTKQLDTLGRMINFLIADHRMFKHLDLRPLLFNIMKREAEYTAKGYQVFHHVFSGIFFTIYRALVLLHPYNVRHATSEAARLRISNLALDGLLPPCQIDWSKTKALAKDRATDIPGLAFDWLEEQSFTNKLAIQHKTEDAFRVLSSKPVTDNRPTVKTRMQSVNYSIMGGWPLGGESSLYYLLTSRSNTNPQQFIQQIPDIDQHAKDVILQTCQWLIANQPLQPLMGVLVLFCIPCEDVDRFVYDSWPWGIPTGELASSFLSRVYLNPSPWEDFTQVQVHQGRVLDLCYGVKGVSDTVLREILNFYDPASVQQLDNFILQKIALLPEN